jgi:hypothetical protein
MKKAAVGLVVGVSVCFGGVVDAAAVVVVVRVVVEAGRLDVVATLLSCESASSAWCLSNRPGVVELINCSVSRSSVMVVPSPCPASSMVESVVESVWEALRPQ